MSAFCDRNGSTHIDRASPAPAVIAMGVMVVTLTALLVLSPRPAAAEGTGTPDLRQHTSDHRVHKSIAIITWSAVAGTRPGIEAQSLPARTSKRKAAIIGAAIGAGAGAGIGAAYCQADCGGGPRRGALIFAPIGAAIGAGTGLLVAILSGQ